jgi:hypothetical protein
VRWLIDGPLGKLGAILRVFQEMLGLFHDVFLLMEN